MIEFVFCHGFGFSEDFWDNLAPYFVQERCSFIDLGYFKRPSSFPKFHGQKIIGIGHSLGLLKLISLYENFECLVGLNGFLSFLGNDRNLAERRRLELKVFEQSFIKNPISTLKLFHKRCGVPEFMHPASVADLDLDLMLSDLEFLKESKTPPSIPTLVLSSNDDVAVPRQLTKDNFGYHPNIELDIIQHGKHGLGFLKSPDVYERIMSFLEDTFAK